MIGDNDKNFESCQEEGCQYCAGQEGKTKKGLEGFIEKRRHYMENPMPYERPTDFQQFCMTLYEALAFPERAKGFKLPAIFQIRKYQLM